MELVVEHLLTSIRPWIPFSAWSLEAQILLVCFCSAQSRPSPTLGSFSTTLGLELPLTSKGPAGHRRFLYIHPGK